MGSGFCWHAYDTLSGQDGKTVFAYMCMRKEPMKKVIYILNNIERYVCIFLISAMLILIAYQVFLRFVMNSPNTWSEELARYLHIYLIFIGGAYATRMRDHIRIDAVINLYPKKIRPFVLGLGEVIWLVFACIIVYVGVKMTMNVANMGQTSAALKIGLHLIYAGLPIGYSLVIIRLVQTWIIDYINYKKKKAGIAVTETAIGKGGDL